MFSTRLRLAALAALVTGGIGYAVAQVLPPTPQVVSVNPTTDLFLDVVNGAPTSPGQYASAAAIDAAPGTQYNVPVTSFSIQVANSTTYLFLNPAGTLAAGTILFPLTPSDGQHFCYFSTQTVTSPTLTAATGTTLATTPTLPTVITLNTQYCYRYVKPLATWYYVATG